MAAAPAGPVIEEDQRGTHSDPAGVPNALVAMLRVLNRMLEAPAGVPEGASDQGKCMYGMPLVPRVPRYATGAGAVAGSRGAGGRVPVP
jgi:hypothetical protein